MVERFLDKLQAMGMTVKYLCCDNAGEHQDKLCIVCEKKGVVLEYTAPNTPQHNGVVERRFVTDRNRAFAMMLSASFSKETQQQLWAEAFNTAEKLGNITSSSRSPKSPDEIFSGKRPTLYPHLVQFG